MYELKFLKEIEERLKRVRDGVDTEICPMCGGLKRVLVIWEYLLPFYKPDTFATTSSINYCMGCMGVGKVNWIEKVRMAMEDEDIVSNIFWHECRRGKIRNVIIVPITDYEFRKLGEGRCL